ncbi:MAG: 16S rRNA (adenine(1518)-N(6)/adenine(1519)-N(6))-dimethyltransferase RsmA [Myxococcota bacterium]
MSAAGVRAFLEKHGLAARRDLGQNFLVDTGVAERLVELAGVEAGQGVLEIGTGLGILTRALHAKGARVVTVEIDAGLVRALRADAVLPPEVELVHGDALEVDLAALVQGLASATSGVKLVANLPYSVSAPLLRRLLDLRGGLVDWSVMLQRDVAQRLLAVPGTKAWGSLALLHRLCVDLQRGMDLSPRCFFPVPKVRSTFVRMQPRDAASPDGPALLRIERVARAAFAQRRKTLANALRSGGFERADAAIAAVGLAPDVRAEALPPEAFLALAAALHGSGEPG